ncbi:Nucleotide-binding alpha-beta plait domain containing protein [Sesbania bispinosa]|nr:Nucleotide-binding alpha-beta plait domain containing protein [Sesbania bispinosa]
MIEGGLLLVILVRPATLDLHHHVIDLALAVVTIIPLLPNEGNIQDLSHLRKEGTVEKDHIHIIAEKGHTHALCPIMGAQEAVVRVQQRAQARAEVQLQTVMMLGNQAVVGPPVSENGRDLPGTIRYWILFEYSAN